MTEIADGVWLSDDAFDLKAGTEFKCRQGLSWSVSYGNGDNNFVVEADGTYKIQLTISGDNGTIELVAP